MMRFVEGFAFGVASTVALAQAFRLVVLNDWVILFVILGLAAVILIPAAMRPVDRDRQTDDEAEEAQ